MKEIYFIINPKAKNGHCLKIWKRTETILQEKEVPYLAFLTDYQGHATKLAAKIASGSEEQKVIIAVGGDGTIHEVVNGIVNRSSITLGFIPGGSGNDFSRGFHIPNQPEDALKVILRLIRKEPAVVDIGRMRMGEEPEHYFINNMGAGFDALISHEVNHSKMKSFLNKLSLGRLVYVYFLLKKLFTYKCSSIDLLIDGEKHIFKDTWFVTVSNQPYYGGGMKIAPTAIADDGILDITVVHNLSKVKLLLVFVSVFWGGHVHFKEVKSFKGRTAALQSTASLYVHADGEDMGYTPLDIQIQAGKLNVLRGTSCLEENNVKERGSNDFQ